MKKIALALSVFLLVAMFTACGPATGGSSSGASTGAPVGSTADYKQVIEGARDPELNGVGFYSVVAGPDDAQYELVFDEAFGFVEADMQRYAISLGTIITLAYGVAIILPAEGKEQAVLDQVNAYVETQKKAQENYLQDQYEIAKNAIVKTAETGEVLLAMCKDAETVMSNMEAGLKAG